MCVFLEASQSVVMWKKNNGGVGVNVVNFSEAAYGAVESDEVIYAVTFNLAYLFLHCSILSYFLTSLSKLTHSSQSFRVQGK